jgi:hypothetical protein
MLVNASALAAEALAAEVEEARPLALCEVLAVRPRMLSKWVS